MNNNINKLYLYSTFLNKVIKRSQKDRTAIKRDLKTVTDVANPISAG